MTYQQISQTTLHERGSLPLALEAVQMAKKKKKLRDASILSYLLDRKEFLQIPNETVNVFKAQHLCSLNAWRTSNHHLVPGMETSGECKLTVYSSVTIQETPPCQTQDAHHSLQGEPHPPAPPDPKVST